MDEKTDEFLLWCLRDAVVPVMEMATRHAAADRIEEYCRDAAVAEELLGRIRAWDMLDTAADGPYWKAEIDKVLRVNEESLR